MIPGSFKSTPENYSASIRSLSDYELIEQFNIRLTSLIEKSYGEERA